MGDLIAGWWSAIWPNLAANVLWVPLAWAHHRWTGQQLDQHHDRLAQTLGTPTLTKEP